MFHLDPPEDDGLYTPEVGPWSADKHHFLRRYIDAFTTAMRKKEWSGLHYVDLFASAGIERVRGLGLDWGSPLIAAQAPHRFAQLHLSDKSKRAIDALTARLKKHAQPLPPQVLRGDANDIVNDIVGQIPSRALTLAFLDPYGLHLHFDTLQKLAEGCRADLIIFFPDHLDALRNWEKVYAGKPDSNLSRVLGTDSWHCQLMQNPRDRWAPVLRQIYQKQIATLGYDFFDCERISMEKGQPLYLLLFCTKNEAGMRIWRNVARKKPGGQDTFGFE